MKQSKYCSKSLNDILKNLSSGTYILPSFQRDYVWTMEQIESLFNSIYRGYPFGSMLFWHINPSKDQFIKKEVFYRFITLFNEENSNSMQNRDTTLFLDSDYWVVLDGQQRLTSLNIGLQGSYQKRKPYLRKKEPITFDEYKLYMLVSKEVENPFEFHKDKKTTEEIGDKWLLVKDIYEKDLEKLKVEYTLSKDEFIRVKSFKNRISKLKIYFSDMQGFSYDEATNIFVKVNSGGTILDMSDILNSMIISTWKSVKAKEEFKQLINDISKIGFRINTNYIVKSILYLHHNDIRFYIQDFSSFITSKESCWNKIKEAILETYNLMKHFGLNELSLSGNNVTLPILYYIYHKEIKDITSKKKYSTDRKIIKQWVLSAILLKIFGRSSDNTLKTIRSVFITDNSSESEKPEILYKSLNTYALKKNINTFPAKKIKEKLTEDWYMSKEIISKRLTETQCGDRYSLPILSLLYPDLKIGQIEFEQDHLHPIALMPQSIKDNPENKKLYNSIINLQLLPKSDNTSKNKQSLENWISANTKTKAERRRFLNEHLIPNVSLNEKDIFNFFEQRKKLLITQLSKRINY